jgi:O-acetyl-ADP-ribose deacetylase (regulator of RNase III)
MIEVVRADITTLDVDAIVNAANSGLAGGGGVDGAIHHAAGPKLAEYAARFAPLRKGHAVLTPGFTLRPFVIHTVGPVWDDHDRTAPDLLRSAYESCFAVALAYGSIRSIAFPAISTGAYRFPKPLAAEIAVGVMRAHESRFQRIVACLFDGDSVRLYEKLLRGAA